MGRRGKGRIGCGQGRTQGLLLDFELLLVGKIARSDHVRHSVPIEVVLDLLQCVEPNSAVRPKEGGGMMVT